MSEYIQPNENDNKSVLNSFIAAKAIEKKSDGTLSLYKLILTNFFDTVQKNYKEITTNDIRVYLYNYQQERNVKNVTLDTMRRIINSFYDWCLEEDLLTHNPVKNIKPIKSDSIIHKPLEQLDLEYMRQACKNPREKAIIDFLYSTGCRVSELCNAKLEDLDWDTKSILIEHGKGMKSRWVYLNAEAEVSLRYYLKTRKIKSSYIFAPCRKCPSEKTNARSIQNLVKQIAQRAGLKIKVTPHTFRRTTATQALRNGMPIEQVQRLLGHSQINTTLIYAQIDDTDVRKSHEKYL